MIPSPLDVIVLILLVLAVGMLVVARARRGRPLEAAPKRILFPFVGTDLSPPALDAALRLCRAEHATLVPAALATVPLSLHNGVPVDSRIERGRSPRHALRELASHERFDRIVVAAGNGHGVAGLDADDIAWLLDELPGEIVVLRPSPR